MRFGLFTNLHRHCGCKEHYLRAEVGLVGQDAY